MGQVLHLPRSGDDALPAEFIGRETYDLAWAFMCMAPMTPTPVYGEPVVLSRIASNGSKVTTTYRLR